MTGSAMPDLRVSPSPAETGLVECKLYSCSISFLPDYYSVGLVETEVWVSPVFEQLFSPSIMGDTVRYIGGDSS